MIIVICLKIAISFYYWVYLISPTVFFTPLLFPSSLLFWFFPFYPIFWLFPYCVLLLLEPKDAMLWRWYIWKFLVLGASFDDLCQIFSSNQFQFERPIKLSFDLNALHKLLSINLSQSGDFISELSIRSLRVSLYPSGISAISTFFFTSPTACLITPFLRIVIVRFWCKKEVLAQVFSKQAYSPMKHSFSICNIVIYQLFTYQSSSFKLMAQTKLCFFPIADPNYPNKSLNL